MTLLGGLGYICSMAQALIDADEKTLDEVYKEQARAILYEAEHLMGKVEDELGVANAGRTDSGLERVQ